MDLGWFLERFWVDFGRFLRTILGHFEVLNDKGQVTSQAVVVTEE